MAFIALAVAVAVIGVRSARYTLPLFERTIEKSSQLAVRWIVVLVFALALLASDLGLDLLLGGFAAGLITRQVPQKREVPAVDSKLNAIAIGVFIPFFFIVNGMLLDVNALFASTSGLAKLCLFFVLFLVVRGTPAMLLYPKVLPLKEDRMALALFSSTQLPPVVAITTIAANDGHMLPSTAAALVGAVFGCRRASHGVSQFGTTTGTITSRRPVACSALASGSARRCGSRCWRPT